MMRAFTALVLLSIPACAAPLADDAFARIAAPGAKVQRVAGGFGQVQGPVWNPRGFWVLSNLGSDRLIRLTPDGKTQPIRQPTGKTNGNAYDSQGRLVCCEQGARRLSRKKPDGTFETLAARFEGKRLNSPHDLALRSDGSIYFTDPSVGVVPATRELDFQGLYRRTSIGQLELLDRELAQPGGLAFSPDEKTLYVSDAATGKIFRYDVDSSGKLSRKTLLATIPQPGQPDGLKVDGDGRVLVAGPGGIWIYAPRGGFLGVLPIPKTPVNLSFGGRDGKTLLIAARDSLYSVRLRVGAAPAQ